MLIAKNFVVWISKDLTIYIFTNMIIIEEQYQYFCPLVVDPNSYFPYLVSAHESARSKFPGSRSHAYTVGT
jgi:hypothetical protein